MNPPEELSSFQANLRRGEMLRDQGRFAEAESYLQRAIGEQPSNADGYYELAFCYCNWDGHGKAALATMDQAISLNPNRADFHALRSWILGNLDKNSEALVAGDEALALNPGSIMALNAQTRAHCHLHDWKRAEANARHTLTMAATNTTASNLLALALRQQGRVEESMAITGGVLSRSPDNSISQSNAGWTALQQGDYRQANQHFLEALRLDPTCENARRGLLHSFNSRVSIYRAYFQFIAWLGRHRKSMRYFFVIVIYIGYRVVYLELRSHFGREGLHWGTVLIAFYLVIFGFGRSFGNLFLLLDPFARHALTGKEKGWSLVAGFIYGALLSFLITDQAWLQAGVLLFVIGLFLWGVLSPRIQDAFSRKASTVAAD